MSWTNLPTDHENISWNGMQKYNLIQNQDGTVSMVDMTEYTGAEKAAVPASEVNQANGGINDLMGHVPFIGQPFSEEEVYSVGDKVVYQNALYKFINAHAGTWNPSDVEEISIMEDLDDKPDKDEVYTKDEVDDLLDEKADADDVYTKEETDDLLDEKADADDVYTKTETDTLLLGKAPVITETASGSIASFTDGSALPVEDLTVAIEPVQDLHGYDYLWPNGGSVNLISDVHNTSNGFLDRKYIKDDGSTVVSDGYCVCEYVPCKPSTIYTCKKYTNAQSIVVAICFYDSEKNFLSGEAYNNRVSYQVTSPENAAFFRTNFDRLETAGSPKYFMVVEGTETPETWLPYSNVCPISGWESTRIFRAGKNLLNPANFDSATVLVSDGIYTFDKSGYNANINTGQSGASGYTIPTTYFPKLPFLQPGTYVWSYKQTSGSNLNRIWSIDNTGEKTSVTTTDLSTEDRKIYRFTITEPTMIIIVRASNTNPTVFSEPQLELGSEFTGYEPYVGDVLSVDFPVSEIAPDGIYYGGTLNILTGELVVDRFARTFNGTEDWAKMSTVENGFWLQFSNNANWPYDNVLNHPFIAISDQYTFATRATTAAVAVGSYPDFYFGLYGRQSGTGQNKSEIYIKDSRIENASAFKAYLAENPLTVVCTLNSPVTVQLTPSQMQTIFGENHIWSNTGDTSVTYRADTKSFIQEQIAQSETLTHKMIADIANGDLAPKTLAVGDLVIVGDELRKATESIGQGSAITSLNSTTANLADVIKALQ